MSELGAQSGRAVARGQGVGVLPQPRLDSKDDRRRRAAVNDGPLSVMVYLRALELGGMQLSLLRLVIGLSSLGFRVRLVVQRNGGILASQVPPGIEVISLNADRTMSSFVPLVRLLRSERPDVVVSGLVHGNLAILAAARLAPGVRTIITEHAPPRSLIVLNGSWRYRLLPTLIGALYPLADAIVAVSQGVRGELAAMLPSRAPIAVIHNPVVPENLPELASRPERDPWLQQGAQPFIVGVGRLCSEKRFDVLIRAFAQLADGIPSNLVIVGEGPERERLEALIDELGCVRG